MSKKNIESAYKLACERYAELGVDVDSALKKLLQIPISLHCWQGDDVRGFENPDGDLTGGIQATGNYPGRARNPSELRGDIGFVLSMVGGTHRVNVHACYAEFEKGKKVDRDELQPEHMQNWIDWCKKNKLVWISTPRSSCIPCSMVFHFPAARRRSVISGSSTRSPRAVSLRPSARLWALPA